MPIIPIIVGVVSLAGFGAAAKVSDDTADVFESLQKAAPWVALAVVGVIYLKVAKK